MDGARMLPVTVDIWLTEYEGTKLSMLRSVVMKPALWCVKCVVVLRGL